MTFLCIRAKSQTSEPQKTGIIILVNTWLALTTGPSTFCSITGQDKEELDVKNHHLKCSRRKVEKAVLMWMCSGFLLMKLLHNADLMTAEPLQTWYLQKSPQCLEKERGRERRDVPLLVVAEQHGGGGGLNSLWRRYRTSNRIQTPTINEGFFVKNWQDECGHQRIVSNPVRT